MQIVKQPQHTNVLPAPDLYSILNEFFDKHRLESAEKTIWNLLIGFLAQRIDEIPVAIHQSDTAYFCANITSLLKDLHAHYCRIKEADSDIE
jgi:hypothetical protein